MDLPFIPMRLANLNQPFDHPDWIFELKYDGFRAIAEIRDGNCRLISRNQHVYSAFEPLAADIARCVTSDCIVDGEIVFLDDKGRPRFYDLLRRRGIPCFVAFDVVRANGDDLKARPLTERKAMLRAIVRERGRVLTAKYVEGFGINLFRLVCAEDLEGIVAKWKPGPYLTGDEQPEDRALARHVHNPRALQRLTWLKIRNANYTQANGRGELFEKKAGGA